MFSTSKNTVMSFIILDYEGKTFEFLWWYTVVNTILHSISLVTVLFLEDWWVPFPKHDDIWWTTYQTKPVFLSILALFLYLSIFSAILHWRWSLKSLFRAAEKHPNFSSLSERLQTFKEAEKLNKRTEWRFTLNLAKSGFFCKTMDGQVLSCFDCGLEITGWKGKNANVSLDDINLMHAASLLKYKIQYIPNALKEQIELETISKTTSPLPTENADVFSQKFSKFYRVKPICGVLKCQKFDFKQQRVRVKTFNSSNDKEIFRRMAYGINEVASAGFVKTSKINSSCYSCLITINWSSSEARVSPSPWALHAWKNGKLEDCSHLRYHLKDKNIRIETFPKHAFTAKTFSIFELAEAGFYCMSRNVNGYLWVRCHQKNCNAYGYYLRPNNKYNAFKKVHTREKLYLLPSNKRENQKLLEVPGSRYGDGNASPKREHPLIDHFLQNSSCHFISKYLESKENRTKTFPLDWAAQNSLQVSIDNVADAGYIYCPESLSYTIVSSPEECKLTQWRKLSAYQELSETSSFTICPKPNCQKVIDWSIVSQKYNLKHQRIRDIPDIGHCSYGK